VACEIELVAKARRTANILLTHKTYECEHAKTRHENEMQRGAFSEPPEREIYLLNNAIQ